MAREIHELVDDLRTQLAKRGHGMTMATLSLAFEINDTEKRGSLGVRFASLPARQNALCVA